MKTKVRILHIDDNIHDRKLVKDALQKEHDEFEVVEADNREKFEQHLAEGDFDLVLSDFNILGFDGLQVLQVVKDKNPDIPVIIATGTGSEEVAIQAMKMGASDYIIKSVSHIRGLAPTIKIVLENKKAQDERKKALIDLNESEKKYRSIYENTTIAILLTSPDGRIFSANDFACTLFNKTEEEICKDGRNGIIDISDPRLPVLLNERKKTGSAKGELSFLKKDGSKFQCEVSSAIFIDKDGDERTSMVIRDLTEQQQAEKQLKTLSNAIEQSPTAIIITNAMGTIEFVNVQFTSFMQYTLEDVKGKTPRIFNPGHTSNEVFETMWQTLRSGKIWQGEFTNRKKDHTIFWENVIISPLVDKNNTISNYILIMEDITDKKKMMDDLITAKEKAEESDNLKTAFLHNISHEIRTPMNAIVGFSMALKNPDLLPEKCNYFTEIIIQSSNQLLAIINDIVSIATIEAGQVQINETETNLNKICNLLNEQFKLKAKIQDVFLNLKTTLPDKEALIFTDEIKLTEILTNLIGNALKFTSKGTVNFGYHLKENNIEFYVEDTGIGIPTEMHNEIFKRFRQVETTSCRQFGGSGLGLSISKAYVELLGGQIWLTSELDKGSVFTFTIPYKKTTQSQLHEKPTNSFYNEPDKFKTLLVAEDTESNFLLLEEIFSEIGLNIIWAKNGLEAIDFCKSNPLIDLVLMDLKMPKMDGFEATKQIKKFRPNLPIIAQTAFSTETDKIKALECGCVDFISKPIIRESLLSKIKKQLLNLH